MAKIREADESRKGYATAHYPTDEPGIRSRIIHVLTLYPRLNHTMLQVGLGTAFPPRFWRPVLNKMIVEGIITQDEEMRQGPTGRYNMYTFLSMSQQVVEENVQLTDAV
jgi:hypothetical protein